MSTEAPSPYEATPMILLEQEDLIQELRRLADLAESDEVVCIALRLLMADGTWKDIIAGGASEAQRAEVLARRQHHH